MNYKTVTTPSKKDNYSNIQKNSDDIFDLSNLNIFDAIKTIIMTSTYETCKNNKTKKIKYKVSAPNIQAILKDIPLSANIELI